MPISAPATAATISGGSASIIQYGAVVFVADGDTIDVKIDGVAPDSGLAGTRVRFLATQAMEMYEYHQDLSQTTGECHALRRPSGSSRCCSPRPAWVGGCD